TAERHALAGAAADRLGAAGHAALDRGDLPGGINLLERTVALLGAEDPRRGEVLPELGLALVQAGQLAHAETVLIDAARAAAGRRRAGPRRRARVARLGGDVGPDPGAARHHPLRGDPP